MHAIVRTLMWTMMPTVLAVAISPAAAQDDAPPIRTRTIEYQIDGQTFAGYLAEPTDITGKTPGVLVVHEWWGLNGYAKRRADMLAELGYVAFAADMYGQGRHTDDPAEAAQWSGALYGKPALRQRAAAALDVLMKQDHVDAQRLAAIGYCFGGTTVQELAFADPAQGLRGVVSFHGSLPAPTPEDLQRTRAAIVFLHGGADSMVPMDKLAAYQQALESSDVDYQIVIYADAKHSFTSPEADARGMEGIGYNAAADRRSWQDMRLFFEELFSR